jgi:hypothetical protein
MTRAMPGEANLSVEDIEALDRIQCIDHWRRQFGLTPPKHVSIQFMRKALAYEAQITAHGAHSKAVRRALKRALVSGNGQACSGQSKASLRPLRMPLSLRPGTHLVREWNGRTYQVEVLEKGFRMDNREYHSLSALAQKITGAHWSGPRFFGLASR